MEIHKEAIACFVITRTGRGIIHASPIVADADGSNGTTATQVISGDECLGTVSAPPNSYAVYGSDDDHPKMILLGYEYLGASHNDWGYVFDERKAEIVNDYPDGEPC